MFDLKVTKTIKRMYSLAFRDKVVILYDIFNTLIWSLQVLAIPLKWPQSSQWQNENVKLFNKYAAIKYVNANEPCPGWTKIT